MRAALARHITRAGARVRSDARQTSARHKPRQRCVVGRCGIRRPSRSASYPLVRPARHDGDRCGCECTARWNTGTAALGRADKRHAVPPAVPFDGTSVCAGRSRPYSRGGLTKPAGMGTTWVGYRPRRDIGVHQNRQRPEPATSNRLIPGGFRVLNGSTASMYAVNGAGPDGQGAIGCGDSCERIVHCQVAGCVEGACS